MVGDSKGDLDRLLLLGVSQGSAGPELQEQLYQLEPQLPRLLAELAAVQPREAMVIVTCERLEFLVAGGADGLAQALAQLMARVTGLPGTKIATQSYRHEGTAALTHLFKVAAALESQVIGEPHVLGQVRQCHRAAAQLKMTGPLLESVLQAAYAAARRVREETPLSEQPTSMAAAALQTARSLHGELASCRALLLGLGEMSELLGDELQQAGLEDLVVMHGSESRAAAAAERFSCHYRPWAELEAALAEADILVSDLGLGRCSITRPMIEAALKQRRRKPMFLIDAAIPGDIEAAVETLEDAFVYSLDDLEQVALSGLPSREAAAAMAHAILAEEQAKFLRRGAERKAAPSIAELRGHFEALRLGVLEDRRLDAEAATHRLINRLLHDPSEVLREAAAEGEHEKARLVEAMTRLFRLSRMKDEENGEDSNGGGRQ
jgi:glutamyl-tRNA reductase